jgi:transcriptional regulator with XRE-family HTH domain
VTDEINARRLALQDQVRILRAAAGLSGTRLAGLCGWPQSKVSKIETGSQTLTDADLVALGRALELPADQLEALRGELREIRIEEARWSRQVRAGHRRVQEAVAQDEAVAHEIAGFQLHLVPGLLQTAPYARAVFESLSRFRETPRDTSEAVRARVERQRILFDESKRISLLMTETPLLYPMVPPAEMLSQIDRLITLLGTRSLRFGIIPAGVALPAAAAHSFTLRDDTAIVELITTEVTTREPEDLDLYRRYLAELWELACEGDAVGQILTRYAAHFRAQL